jgi:CBS domain-containing protein
VDPDSDREDVARLISKYDLLALPVVDQAGRILGIVTVDDVIDVMVAEQTEDAQKFGGLEALDESYTEVGFGATIRKRVGWLTALFIGEMFTATAMGRFEHEIERVGYWRGRCGTTPAPRSWRCWPSGAWRSDRGCSETGSVRGHLQTTRRSPGSSVKPPPVSPAESAPPRRRS